jgi:dienelactone hydrolase
VRRVVTLGALAVVIASAALVGPAYLRGATLVADAANVGGWIGRLADAYEQPHRESPARIPWRGGSLNARAYTPAEAGGPALLVVPGVHAAGIDEPRLVSFATQLAARGFSVLTVELPDLRRYAITPQSTDMIEDAGGWLAATPGLARGGRIGVVGISFAGGLSVVAAGRPALRDRVAFVLSFGGHADLPRTLRYLCTGEQPDGQFRAPHDYGVAIILLGVAERVVPADQVSMLRDGIRVFLEASHADMVDRARGAMLFKQAVEMAERMPEPSATLMRHVNERNVARLGPILLDHLGALGGDAALSPARSPAPRAPVFLLHGADDNVIPAVESELLARQLEPHTRVRLLLTPLITHAEVNRPSDIADILRLVAFWTDVLDE